MRIDTKKWLNDFDISTTDNISGLIDNIHCASVIPIKPKAQMNLLLEYGYAVDSDANKKYFEQTPILLGKILVRELKPMLKDDVMIGKSIFDSKKLRLFTKHYRRADDSLTIYGGDKNSIIRMLSPCGDWLFLLAPVVNDSDTHFNHASVIELDEIEKELW
jgi:hypothetical protein